jgi:hypothetical protein
MANLSREQMREYQRERRARMRGEANGEAPPHQVRPTAKDHPLAAQAERARIKAQREYEAPGGRGATAAQVIAAGERAAACVLAGASPPKVGLGEMTTAAGPPSSRALTVVRAPLQGEILSPPRSLIADGGTPPRRYAKDASVAEATALIRAFATEQALINAETARRLAALERHVAVEERNKAMKAAGVAKWAEAQRLFFNMLRP